MSFDTLFPSTAPNGREPLEFSSLKELIEHVQARIGETGIEHQRLKFHADVVKVKDHNGSKYITVSQETSSGENFELTVIVWKNNVRMVAKTLQSFGLRGWEDLVDKKWEFQGKLKFYDRRAQFSFYADTIVPQGESDILKRRERIKNILRSEGLLVEVQHELTELEPIRLIALITSKSAQGYFDFQSNLLLPDEYRPIVHLYQSTMQGPSTAQEVILALDQIENFYNTHKVKYDVVVLIRGGGGPSDLMHFDDLELARRIARMNKLIPVLTGIGHEKDVTIPDFVAWRRFPTPTAVAKEIVAQLRGYIETLDRNRLEVQQYFASRHAFVSKELEVRDRSILESPVLQRFRSLDRIIEESARAITAVPFLREVERKIETELLGHFSRAAIERLEVNARFLAELDASIQKHLVPALAKAFVTLEAFSQIGQLVERNLVDGENELNKLLEGLTESGGTLASLLYGGVVVLKNAQLQTSASGLCVGDHLEVRFLDGVAEVVVRDVETSGRSAIDTSLKAP